MITHARRQATGRAEGDTTQVFYLNEGAPVEVLQTEDVSHSALAGRNLIRVRTDKGIELVVQAADLEPFSRDETLRVLAKQTGVSYNTLVKAAQAGRLLTRRSGAVRLTTVRAIQYAIEQGLITPRKRNG